MIVYIAGRENGRNEGYNYGYTWGYEYGKEDGVKKGFRNGFNKAIEIAQTPPNYLLHDPTLQEAIQFIIEDKTNEKEFSEPEFTCDYFATETANNAKKRGIRAGTVWMNMEKDKGHSIIVFNTIDRGEVYFEPQVDMPVAKPEKGGYYLKNPYKITAIKISW